jgi:hypothetical protein
MVNGKAGDLLHNGSPFYNIDYHIANGTRLQVAS